MPRKKGVSLSIGRGEKSRKGGLTAKVEQNIIVQQEAT